MLLYDKFSDYSQKLYRASQLVSEDHVNALVSEVWIRLQNRKKIFLCGNGGSSANASHIENDFLYGICKKSGCGANVESLTSNSAVLTCLANDISYSNIFVEQLKVKSSEGDLLIVLSGSGNSENIIQALTISKELGLKTAAILGFDGGKAKSIADIVIHSDIDDMQISEDIQTMVLHHVMQICYARFQDSRGN
jgi:D-sedoheptulose 7-phosphate isomerase